MPFMNGIEATKEIRKMDKSVPIIAITADNVLDSNWIEAGVTSSLLKPFNKEQLISKIIEYVSEVKN